MAFSNAIQARNIAKNLYKFKGVDTALGYRVIYETRTLTYWKYHEGAWSVYPLSRVMRDIRSYLIDPRFEENARIEGAGIGRQLTSGTYDDIAKQITYEVDNYDVLEDDWIAFLDGSWNPKTGEFAEHRPERFATAKVAANFGNLPTLEDAPNFRKFLEGICVDANGSPLPAMRDRLQEMFGYVLLPHSNRAVSFFLSGGGRNGKGVVTGLLQTMVGRHRVSNKTLEALTKNTFATSALVGMKLNVCDEEGTHREAASAMFKKVVAGDYLDAEKKFGHSFSFKPRVTVVVSFNGSIVFDGFGYAMRERIKAIPFFRKFTEDDRDYDLEERITRSEMPSVIAWSMEGLLRLQKNGMRFTTYREAEDQLREFENASSSLAEYIDAEWEGSDVPFPAKDFYAAYVKWSIDSGRKPKSQNTVSREVNERFGSGRSVRVGNSVASGLMVKRKPTEEEKATLNF